MAKNLADLRFIVEGQDGVHSGSWRLWITRPGDIYVAAGKAGGLMKVSFHKSGIARYAFTEQSRAAGLEGQRLMHRWKEPSVPPSSSGQFARLAWFAFPTDYLSKIAVDIRAGTCRIPAASAGRATLVELGLTGASEPCIAKGATAIADAGLLLFCEARSGVNAFVRWQHDDWKNKDLTMPASHGLSGYRFLAAEVLRPDRPIRIHLQNNPDDGEALLVEELGGCVFPP